MINFDTCNSKLLFSVTQPDNFSSLESTSVNTNNLVNKSINNLPYEQIVTISLVFGLLSIVISIYLKIKNKKHEYEVASLQNKVTDRRNDDISNRK